MATFPTAFSTIDLSRLASPAAVARLDYDACFAAILADFRVRFPAFDAVLASDPAVKLLEVAAYRETLLRGAINDALRATMLAFAGGADLDQLAAFYGLSRLTVAPARDDAPAMLESDADLRARAQLAPELLAGPGLTGGGYRAAVMTLAPSLKDVAVLKRPGGIIDLVLLGRSGDGAVDSDLVSTIFAAFQGDAASQLTDTISVRSAQIVPYSAAIVLRIRTGPDPELVRFEADAAIRRYAAARHRIGEPVFAQMLTAAAAVGGVEQALVDIDDIVPAGDAAPFLSGLTVTVEVVA